MLHVFLLPCRSKEKITLFCLIVVQILCRFWTDIAVDLLPPFLVCYIIVVCCSDLWFYTKQTEPISFCGNTRLVVNVEPQAIFSFPVVTLVCSKWWTSSNFFFSCGNTRLVVNYEPQAIFSFPACGNSRLVVNYEPQVIFFFSCGNTRLVVNVEPQAIFFPCGNSRLVVNYKPQAIISFPVVILD
jgi:hypothetical protein